MNKKISKAPPSSAEAQFVGDRILDFVDLVAFRFDYDRESAASLIRIVFEGLLANPDHFKLENFTLLEIRKAVEATAIQRTAYLSKKNR